jgi:transcriptional regulator with XRE-family HTH domain
MSGSYPIQVGQRIRHFRHRRGLSQQAAAELAGLTQTYLSLIENGRRGVDRRSTMAAIARALRVSVVDLVGQWWPDDDPVHARASAQMGRVRAVLMDSDTTAGAEYETLPLDRLEAEHDLLLADTVTCRLPAAADRLVTLLGQSHAAVTGPDRARALRLVVGVCQRGGRVRPPGRSDAWRWLPPDLVAAMSATVTGDRVEADTHLVEAQHLAVRTGDRARALHLLGDHEGSIRQVAEAERIAPLWAPRDEGLRAVVAAACHHRRRASDPELDRMAVRFGVASGAR